jgi:hypothetical protein
VHAGLGHRGCARYIASEDAHADRADPLQPLKLPVDTTDVPPSLGGSASAPGVIRRRDAARHVLVADEDQASPGCANRIRRAIGLPVADRREPDEQITRRFDPCCASAG